MSEQDELAAAVKSGDLHETQKLLAKNPELADAPLGPGVSATLLALYYGHKELAAYIYTKQSSPDIFTAASMGDIARLEILVSGSPQQVNAFSLDGFQPLGLACFFGQPGSARFLLQYEAQVNSPSRNMMQVMPLHSAAASQQVEIARLLLKAGAPVNAEQQDGFTALHSAAQNGQIEMIRLLLEHGADLTRRSARGKTPSDLAIENGHQAAFDLLTSR